MHFIIRKPWDLSQSRHTPQNVFQNRRLHRREFLKDVGISVVGLASAGSIVGCSRPTEEEVSKAGAVEPLSIEVAEVYPASQNSVFEYGRPETAKRDAAEYCNFFEFSTGKSVWRHVDKFTTSPWSIEIDGLCAKPRKFDLDDIYESFSFEERAYRHRCVETWAMCVPWTGFPLRDLLKSVEPKPSAKFVAFETFNRPEEAANMVSGFGYSWPYTEGLTIEEAASEVAFIATGVYGEQLPRQHGAPIRLVVPWKYGFKSSKSIVKITLTDRQPATFWNTVAPHEYGFEANVDPAVSHPRWSQETEWMLGTRERFDTVIYNGYGEHVGGLYSG